MKAKAVDWLLATQLSIQKGVPDDARVSLEKVLSDPTATEREQFQAILFQLATSQNQDQVKQAWSRLENFRAVRARPRSTRWLLLARRALLRGAQTSEDSGQTSQNLSTLNPQLSTSAQPIASDAIAAALESHHWRKRRKIAALDVRAGLADAQREQLIARAIAEFKDVDAIL